MARATTGVSLGTTLLALGLMGGACGTRAANQQVAVHSSETPEAARQRAYEEGQRQGRETLRIAAENKRRREEYYRREREERDQQDEQVHGPEWAARKRAIQTKWQCPPGTKAVRSVREPYREYDWCERESDGVPDGPARRWDRQTFETETFQMREGKVVRDQEASSENEAGPVQAVFMGQGQKEESFTSAELGGRCKASAHRQLVLSLRAGGRFTWSGFSIDGIHCSGQASPAETRCHQEGDGRIEVVGGTAVFRMQARQAAGLVPADLSHRIWQCGSLRVVLPAGVELGSSCAVVGNPENDPGEVAAAQVACTAAKPWGDLDGAKVTVRPGEIIVPWWAGRARLVLRKVSRDPSGRSQSGE
jgi:hypothetical protein